MRSIPKRLLSVLLVLAISNVAAAGILRKPRKGRGIQVRVGSYTIQPSQDLEVCEYRRLPNKKPIDVSRFELRMPPGAHHFAVWTYGGSITDDAEFPAGPVPTVGCASMAADELIPQLLIPTTTPNAAYRFPKGVALQLAESDQLFLNPHMRNLGTDPVVPDIRFNLYAAKKGSVRHYAQGLTFGNSSNIHVPGGGDQTLSSEWTVPVDLTIVLLTTHQHSLGTHAKIELVATDGVSRSVLVESDDWEHPPSTNPPAGLRLEKGRKLRLTCTWHNPGANAVTFGPKTTDEMCYGIGFYYRDTGDTTPAVGVGCIPSEKGLLCPFVPAVVE